jgi:hypothetical protein
MTRNSDEMDQIEAVRLAFHVHVDICARHRLIECELNGSSWGSIPHPDPAAFVAEQRNQEYVRAASGFIVNAQEQGATPWTNGTAVAWAVTDREEAINPRHCRWSQEGTQQA